MYNKYKDRIIEANVTLIQSLKIMDERKTKVLFVFLDNKFLGMLTLGDIQRAIIANVSLSSPVKQVLDPKKYYAKEFDSPEDIKNVMFTTRTESMPVVDEKGNLLKVYFWDDFFGEDKMANKRNLNLPVVIMAGGKGSRLKPLTNVIPKPLLPIGEKTIIELIMDQFEEIGCTKFFLSVNYKSEILKYYMQNLEHPYDITYFQEDKPLGTIGSVSLLKNKINTPFFVSNCDIIIDQDYSEVYDYHMENQNYLTIIAAIKNQSIPYGIMESGEKGELIRLEEKPEVNYMINTGVYLLNPDLIDEIPVNTLFHITQLINKVKTKGGKIGCFPVSEKAWTDIGDWDEYLKWIKK
jgi:dTDP-glucose pyrophosphorylase